MKRVAVFVTVLTAALAVGTAAMAATMGREAAETDPQDRNTIEPFTIQARVLQIGSGWLEVETAAVQQGADVAPNARLLILETAATKFLTASDTVSIADLKVGEMVRIVGTISRTAYRADSITRTE